MMFAIVLGTLSSNFVSNVVLYPFNLRNEK